MRKKLLVSCITAAAVFFTSCGGGGGGSSGQTGQEDNYVSVAGAITEGSPTTQGIKVGNSEISYVVAATFVNDKPLFVSGGVDDTGHYQLKLIKDKEYAFVLYDNDLNPVAFVEKGNNNAIVVKGDVNMDIKLIDENGDGTPDKAEPDVKQNDTDKISFNKDPKFEDKNNDGKPDFVEVDTDNDGKFDGLEDKNNNGIPDSMEDNNADGKPDVIEDRDGDGIPHGVDDDEKENHGDNENGENHGGNNGGNNYGGSNNPLAGDYIVVAWNDLGMHCIDKDFSVFSILPPYNTINAHVIKRGHEPEKLSDASVKVYYLAQSDNDGTINTTSVGKTNFWDYVQSLFGVSLQPDVGLKGFPMASTTPSKMHYLSGYRIFQAEGIPATPYDDSGTKDEYPLVKVVAKDLNGNILAQTTTVMPVSDEMTCTACHSSNSGNLRALPTQPENDPNPEKDYRWNILKKHDEEVAIPQSVLSALASKGYNYQASLYQTAKNGTPVLCSACHKSNALPGSGVAGVPPLTQAIHSKHAKPVANTGRKGRNACYLCHPGSQTQCLRGAMGNAHVECQSCHGTMADVGSSTREGWLDMPKCQQCHQGGNRYKTVFQNDVIGGTLRAVVDNRFATQPNTPMSGKSLYRLSKGHGGLQCETCHGSPHAIYPSSLAKDNMQIEKLQGYKGTLRECFVCHKDQVPFTADEGPHGMHTIGQAWVNGHGDYVEGHGYGNCKACHGTDLRGSELSEVKTTKSFHTEWGTKTFQAGHAIGCYDCHNGPHGD